MPFKGNRIGIIAIIVFLFIAVVLVAASGGGKPSTSATAQRPAPKYKFTIASDSVGDDYILITNEATGAKIIITQNMMPFTANFAKDDVLTFKVTPKEGYIFNAWAIDDGTWESSNPLSVRPSGDFSMKAYFLAVETE